MKDIVLGLLIFGLFGGVLLTWAHFKDLENDKLRENCQAKCGIYKVDRYLYQCVCDMTKVIK